MFKKMICALLAATLCVSMNAASIYAIDNADGYHPSMDLVGLSYDDYANMLPETQAFYRDTEVIHATSTTKYYRISPNASVRSLRSNSASSLPLIEEITQAEYAQEVAVYLQQCQDSNIARTRATDSSSANWARMTTTLAEVRGERQWLLSSEVTLLGNPSQLGSTYIIGLGTNANTSIITGSSYCIRNYTFANEADSQNYYASNIQTKTAHGYALSMEINPLHYDNEVYFLVSLGEHVDNLNYIDGYGHFAMAEEMLDFDLSFSGSDGGDLSISPGGYIQSLNNTHVQLSY